MSEQLKQRIAQLSPAQRALLERQIQLKTSGIAADRAISSINKTEELSISFAQQRLWFLSLLEPESAIYNRPANIQLEGQLNIAILERCLNEIMRRHQVLRSNFISVDGQPKVVIKPECKLSLSLVELSAIAIKERENKLQQLLRQFAQNQFDLARDCLVKAGLVKLSTDEHLLLLTFHHSVFDGWSMEVLLCELTTLYDAFSQDQISPFPELAIQYSDFANWQIQQFKHADYQTKLDYWKQQLGGELPILELPIDRPRPPIQTFRGARYTHTISLELTQALKQFSQKQNATLFMTLLAVYQVLLHRYSGQTDIIVGTPIAGRDRLETENLIGVFINTLALRISLTNNPTFREVLAQVRRVALAAYAHQEITIEKLVEELEPERSLSHPPLFQTIFQLRNMAKVWQTTQGLKWEETKTERSVVSFDISLDITVTKTGLVCQFEYNTDLFDRATIARMAAHFQVLLEGVAINPELSIAQLPLLTAAERQQILVDWNDTATEYPQEKFIHQLFEEQVARTPESIAVVFENRQLTYRELNDRADRLAGYLQTLGVQPDCRVGIAIERSLETIVGLLGILKAGGAYVPLDLTYPQERLAFIVEDTQISILLTDREHVDRLAKLELNKAIQIINLELNHPIFQQQYPRNYPVSSTSANLAYINYTSGSTGIPKGVEISHCNVIKLLFGVDYMRLGMEEKFLQMAPLSFDAATFEIWGALLHGSTCVLFPDRIPTAQTLGEAIASYGITSLWLTAALFNNIIDDRPEVLSPLKQLLVGGEALAPDRIQTALATLPNTQIINGYGPTENTTFTCCYPIPKNFDFQRRSIPIGRPLANTQTYILDAYLQPVPIGISGQLYIGGDGLARGYLNRPELTAEKFIANPFGAGKIYQTGDLTRHLVDGNIEYIGRIDNQVKIRGFRIELGEIETVLSQHPDVLNTVAIAREDSPGDRRIIAYVVPQAQARSTFTQAELRQFINRKLPDYMIPSAVVVLENLPLTPNGKIDRRALPAPDRTRSIATATPLAPRNELERQLVAIWEELLKIGSIGIADNFFELGGHSLLATQVSSRIQTIYSLSFPLRYIFEYPTIDRLAERLGMLIDSQFALAPDLEYEQGEI